MCVVSIELLGESASVAWTEESRMERGNFINLHQSTTHSNAINSCYLGESANLEGCSVSFYLSFPLALIYLHEFSQFTENLYGKRYDDRVHLVMSCLTSLFFFEWFCKKVQVPYWKDVQVSRVDKIEIVTQAYSTSYFMTGWRLEANLGASMG